MPWCRNSFNYFIQKQSSSLRAAHRHPGQASPPLSSRKPRAAIRDREKAGVSICGDPGLYLGTAELSIANESESISP
jgi:hypothetical protein